jgi:hypothetical protein
VASFFGETVWVQDDVRHPMRHPLAGMKATDLALSALDYALLTALSALE